MIPVYYSGTMTATFSDEGARGGLMVKNKKILPAVLSGIPEARVHHILVIL
jgi:hypothetical protein